MIRIYPVQMAEVYKARLGTNGAIWAIEMFLKNYPAFKPQSYPYISPRTKYSEAEPQNYSTRKYWLEVLEHLGVCEISKGPGER